MEITIKGTSQEIAEVLQSIGAKQTYTLPSSPSVLPHKPFKPEITCGDPPKKGEAYVGETAPVRLL